MRRPAIVAMLAVLVLATVSWAAVTALTQPGTRPGPTAPQAVGGYLPGSATRAASGSTAVRPGQVLDLRNWYLTLPTGAAGEPDTVHQPALAGYAGPSFQLDPGRDGVVFTADAGGVTTAHSTYPRSELREMDGDKQASWSNRTGTHTLEVHQAVLQLPPAKPEVVTAQIHDSESDVMEIRLEGNRLIAQYADGKKEFDVDPHYVLGTPYALRLVASNGRIDVWYNGNRAGSIDQTGDGWYFKTGSYLQSNPEKGDAADAVARVVLYSVGVTHTA